MTEKGAGTGYEPLRYHELTKHSPKSVRAGSHRLDWMDQPDPFKSYPDLQPLSLPKRAPNTSFPTMEAVAGRLGKPRPLDLPELSRLLVLAAGVRRVRPQTTGKPVHLRTYASAGALYPNEVYVACAAIDGLDAGLYHYSPRDDGLRLLRSGDPRPHLVRAAGGRRSVGRAPLAIILTGIPWRTNWKYRARGYRHLYWDAGMILANLLGLCAAGGHSSEVVLGFVDSELDTFVGIDGHSEMSICMVPIGYREAPEADVPAAGSPPSPIGHAVGRLSFRQREYDEVIEAHLMTGLRTPAEAALWQQERYPNAAPPPAALCFDGIEKVIRRRGSKREFEPVPILAEELESIIGHAVYDLECDWGLGLTQVGAIVNDVDGVEPGAYSAVYGMQQIAFGKLREKARFLCLEQDLGGDAAATLFLFTDLENAASTLGARSYRAAQLNAGIVGGRMYLCAYACGAGATGLTFYDDEVRSFFHTEAEPMLVVALGH
jgi:SagB-type dehydrogenase family enzyme